jgi:hypothetical protein
LAARLRPAAAIPEERLRKLIRELDSTDFDAREKATAGLAEAGEQAEPILQEALKGAPTAEARKRVERLLDALASPTVDGLRQTRALEILEQLGTPEARKVLERLAGGADAAALTRQAKQSVARLAAARNATRP